MPYHELSIEERVTIQIGQLHGLGPRALGRMLNRSPSTVSRELLRNRATSGAYIAHQAQGQTVQRRKACRPATRLLPGSELFELVIALLRQRFSPEQIAGKLRRMSIPSFEDAYVCRETISNAIYALQVG
jgi:IS30 family transposase